MQTSGVTQYPVSISMNLYAPQTNVTIRQNDSTVGAIERRLEAFSLDQFSVREAVKSEMALMQATFEKCQEQLINKTLAFVTQVNGEPQRQKTAVDARLAVVRARLEGHLVNEMDLYHCRIWENNNRQYYQYKPYDALAALQNIHSHVGRIISKL